MCRCFEIELLQFSPLGVGFEERSDHDLFEFRAAEVGCLGCEFGEVEVLRVSVSSSDVNA